MELGLPTTAAAVSWLGQKNAISPFLRRNSDVETARIMPRFFCTPLNGRVLLVALLLRLTTHQFDATVNTAALTRAMIKTSSVGGGEATVAVVPATAAAGTDGVSSGVRFVAVPGSGMEAVFPRPGHANTVDTPAALASDARPKASASTPADRSWSTLSSSLTGSTLPAGGGQWEEEQNAVEGASSAVGTGGVVRAATASASTQVPDLELSEWINPRSR